MARSRTVVAYSPDGQEISWQTGGKYSVAGIARRADGRWMKVHHGSSERSVRSRTRAWVSRMHYMTPCTDMAVVAIHEVTAPVLREYFGTHAVRITATFRSGWTPVTTANGRKGSYHGGRSMLRTLIKDGVAGIAVTANGRTADFTMVQVEQSLRTRKAS